MHLQSFLLERPFYDTPFGVYGAASLILALCSVSRH